MFRALLSCRALLGWSVLIISVGTGRAQSLGDKPSIPAAATQRALLDRYCVTCHNEKLKTANLQLDKADVNDLTKSPQIWEKVVRKVRGGEMPPAKLPRPDKAGYDFLISYLETSLDAAALAKPNPGRATLHRLNRTEYTNAIHDLLDLEINGAALLPEDDSGYGFDNNGDVLSVSPLLVDRYMSAAHQISRLALGDVTLRLPISTYKIPELTAQDSQADERLPFGSRGGISVSHRFPVNGEYVLRVRLQYLDKNSILALTEPHELDIRLDRVRIKRFAFGGATAATSPDALKPEENTDAGLEVRFTATAGTHLVGVAFRDEKSLSEGMYRPPFVQLKQDGQGPKIDKMSDPAVASLAIAGPYGAKSAGDAPSRRKIFVCHPTGAKDEDVCAKKILSSLARRAYRRPVTDSDVDGLMGLYRSAKSGGFDAGIDMALQGILLSRDFLFRKEHDPANGAPDAPYRISDIELASRLSFFLWSSIPDDQLLSLAEAGKLKNTDVLEQQVRRMLADPRSKALVSNFGAEWLNLRAMQTVEPERSFYPEFDDDLRTALTREVELFLEDNLRQDRSVLTLLNSDYTFVNQRLAQYYGIPNVYGSRFRRVTLQDENRWGLLGKGAILTVTSYPLRTSPVERGKWVLENVLGTPPPNPPPNVPALTESRYAQPLTIRQRMEQHRASPACASCHARMDPLGFALENYDAIGRWRTSEGGKPIDTSGVLPDGSKFQGPAELRRILTVDPRPFAALFGEKLLTYAMGRGVEYYDEPAVRGILKQAASKDYVWSEFIVAIVKSVPFQMRSPAERTATASLR